MRNKMMDPRLNEACLLEDSWNENEKLGFDAQRQTHTIFKLYSIYPSLSVLHRAGTLYSADKQRSEVVLFDNELTIMRDICLPEHERVSPASCQY